MNRQPKYSLVVAPFTIVAFLCASSMRIEAQTTDGGVPPASAPVVTPVVTTTDADAGTADAYVPPAPPAPDPTLTVAPAPATVDALAKPRDTRFVYKRRWGLFAAGLVLFLIGYGSDIGVTYGFGHTPQWTSTIPLVGPLIQLSERFGLEGPPVDSGDAEYDRKINSQIDAGNSVARGLIYTGLALNAVLQLGGMTMLILGAVLKKKVAKYAGQDPRRAPRSNVSVTGAPGGLQLTW